MQTNIIIHNIFTSPEHHYFTREKFNVGHAKTITHQSIECSTEKGLPNDRFEFSKYPITLISLEVAQEVCEELNIPFDIKLFRRNIVVSGVYLNALIGKEFTINYHDNNSSVIFEGLEHCAPCTWMNAVMKKGAYKLMSGRGGLRAKILHGGILNCGENILSSNTQDIVSNPCGRLLKPKIP